MSKYPDVQEIQNFQAVDGTHAAVAARLTNFQTGKFELQPGHKLWLHEKALPVIEARPNAWVDLYGYASKLGKQQSNMTLSRNRASAPRDFLRNPLMLKGRSIDKIVNIDFGFGEDHPDYREDQTDNSGYWRAAEVLVFGSKPKVVRRKPKPRPASTSFEIRVVGGGSGSLGVQADDYFFQVVDKVRRRTMFFLYTGVGLGISIPKIPGPGSVTKSGPPTTFTTSRPVELYTFNSPASLYQDPGATLGPLSVGGTLRLSLKKILDDKGMVFTKPRIIPIEGGAGIQMPGIGSATEGVLAKVSDEFPFTGY